MTKAQCGVRARFQSCPKGPKGRHKCGERHLRGGASLAHSTHACKHCGATFT